MAATFEIGGIEMGTFSAVDLCLIKEMLDLSLQDFSTKDSSEQERTKNRRDKYLCSWHDFRRLLEFREENYSNFGWR